MSPERWQRIDELYHAALGQEPERRERYLAEACGGDPSLQRIVRELLAQDSGGTPILDQALWRAEDRSETLAVSGQEFGAYRIVSPIGAGGMGAVFLAEDTRLGRKVAIKISRKRYDSRFEREARAVAALHHPSICALYDVGPNYMVMELLEGETLAARIGRGKLSLDEVVRYGRQIAEALAEAHAKGIVHRDLKPANIMLTRTGLKVLDFGLARMATPPGQTFTDSHVIMGTPAYMAPEQLEGKDADARTDIYALGLVLAEMATGRRQSTEGLSGTLGHVVERCLAKEPEARWQSAADVKLELEWAGTDPAARPEGERRGGTKWWLWAALAAACVALGTGGAILWTRQTPAEARVYRFSLAPPPDAEFLNVPNRNGLALSPDGDLLVFLAIRNGQSRLWVQRLDDTTARELAGTEDAAMPFWSPDSRSIGFFAGGSLKRVDTDGGNLRVLTEVLAPRGADWGRDGTIVFAPDNRPHSRLYRISAAGGQAVPVTTVDEGFGELYHAWPLILEDQKRFLYWARGTAGKIQAGSFADPKFRMVVVPGRSWLEIAAPNGGGPRYGLWNREETIVAQRWDPAALRLSGEPVPIGGPVGILQPIATFTVADAGVLVYAGPVPLQLQWVDRNGQPLGMIGEPGHYAGPGLSPDGAKVAAVRGGKAVAIDWRRGVTTLLTNAGTRIIWSPDGRQVAFARDGRVVITRADGTGEDMPVPSAAGIQEVACWTPDGRSMIYSEVGAEGRRSLWIAPVEELGAKRKLIETGHDETHAAVSEDGKWLAYATDESGRFEVYVRKMEGGSRTQVSSNGGNTPRWRRDGGELYYEARDGSLMSVSVKASAMGMEFGAPQRLFSMAATYVSGNSYDAAPDGQRFIVIAPYRARPREPLTVVVNWPALLKGRL